MAKRTKKRDWIAVIWMIIYWAFYLTLTMAFFERYHITPEVVPGGFVGWMIIVEVPRVILGFLISIPVFRRYYR